MVGIRHNDDRLSIGFGFGFEKFDTWNHREFADNKQATLLSVMLKC
jgi:hypothetical protein